MKRGRNQRRRPGGGSNPNRALDSNGPDVRIRGTANQIYDKYQALARDASSAGDRVKAESYLQHAEHYFRLIRSMQPAQQPNQQPSDNTDGEQPSVDDNDQEQPQRETKPRAPRRNGNAPSENDGGDSAPAAKEDSAAQAAPAAEKKEEPQAAAEEEKKPRRRRAPRRTTKKDDDSAAETPPAAAAE